jgi:UDP-glucose 4-epimerase
VTKLAAEHLCHMHFLALGLNCIILRTSRFFPENDDTLTGLSGANLKANEFLFRRLSVEDAARAHVAALEQAPGIGFGVYVISAPTPFVKVSAFPIPSCPT